MKNYAVYFLENKRQKDKSEGNLLLRYKSSKLNCRSLQFDIKHFLKIVF